MSKFLHSFLTSALASTLLTGSALANTDNSDETNSKQYSNDIVEVNNNFIFQLPLCNLDSSMRPDINCVAKTSKPQSLTASLEEISAYSHSQAGNFNSTITGPFVEPEILIVDASHIAPLPDLPSESLIRIPEDKTKLIINDEERNVVSFGVRAWNSTVAIDSVKNYLKSQSDDSENSDIDSSIYLKPVIDQLNVQDSLYLPETFVSFGRQSKDIKWLPGINRLGYGAEITYSSSDLFGVYNDGRQIWFSYNYYSDIALAKWAVELNNRARMGGFLSLTPIEFDIKQKKERKNKRPQITIIPSEFSFQTGISYVDFNTRASANLSGTAIFQALGSEYIYEHYGVYDRYHVTTKASGTGWYSMLNIKPGIEIGDVGIQFDLGLLKENFGGLNVTETIYGGGISDNKGTIHGDKTLLSKSYKVSGFDSSGRTYGGRIYFKF